MQSLWLFAGGCCPDHRPVAPPQSDVHLSVETDGTYFGVLVGVLVHRRLRGRAMYGRPLSSVSHHPVSTSVAAAHRYYPVSDRAETGCRTRTGIHRPEHRIQLLPVVVGFRERVDDCGLGNDVVVGGFPAHDGERLPTSLPQFPQRPQRPPARCSRVAGSDAFHQTRPLDAEKRRGPPSNGTRALAEQPASVCPRPRICRHCFTDLPRRHGSPMRDDACFAVTCLPGHPLPHFVTAASRRGRVEAMSQSR
jgi:hypothetical protein